MNTFMDDFAETFCRNLKEWFDENYRGSQKQFLSELNEFIRKNISKEKSLLVGDKQLSNVFNGRRSGGEKWRRIVSDYIGVPYEDMIGLNKSGQTGAPENQGRSAEGNLVEIEQAGIIERFRNEDLAKAINEKLLVLESMNPDEMKEIEDYIQFRIAKYDRRKTDHPDQIPPTGDRRKKSVG